MSKEKGIFSNLFLKLWKVEGQTAHPQEKINIALALKVVMHFSFHHQQMVLLQTFLESVEYSPILSKVALDSPIMLAWKKISRLIC